MAKAKKAEQDKEAPEEGAEGEAAPKKRFLSKKLIIIAAAALIPITLAPIRHPSHQSTST